MTIKSAIGFLSLFIVLQACESKFAELPQGNQAAEATFTSVIDDRVMSRAVNASWEANDVIGLFMLDNANKRSLKPMQRMSPHGVTAISWEKRAMPFIIRKTERRWISLLIIRMMSK